MIDWGQGAIYGALFASGLAGSFHCLAMCGPLLIGFSELTEGRQRRGGWVAYHLGRLWTYAGLGFLVGWGSFELRRNGSLPGQRGFALAVAALLITLGLASLLSPGFRTRMNGQACRALRLVPTLARDPRPAARLLLGALLGLLPCAMVYAALLMAALLPTPLHSALGMLAFGLGTLPSLSALLLARHWVARRLPAWRGAPLLPVLWVSLGTFVMVRAWMQMLMAH